MNKLPKQCMQPVATARTSAPVAALATSLLLAAVGSAASAHEDSPAKPVNIVPLHKAGVLYVNMETGERSLTRYTDAKSAEIQPYDPASRILFDYWMCLDENPCWDDPRAEGFGFFADSPSDSTGTSPITEPIVGFDFGDLPFNSSISGVIINTATLKTEDVDSDGDGDLDTGYDVSMVFYDALSESNATSIAPPTAAVRIQAIPGNRGEIPNGFSDYELILDFGSSSFELGDDDGQSLGDLWLPGANGGRDLSALITTQVSCETTPSGERINCQTITIPNPSPDGLADFQYAQYYTQFDTDNKVTDNTTFIGIGAPEGTVSFSTFTTQTTTMTPTVSTLTSVTTVVTITVTDTIFIPDSLPQAQGTRDSFGVAALGSGADTTNLDWSPGDRTLGCCFWFGGLDCAGFLDQVNFNVDFDASWYNFTGYAQIKVGLLTDQVCPPNTLCSPCENIDFLADGIIDNGDIGAFVGLFIAQDPSADLNGDGYSDNGDISTFIELYLSCVG